MSYELFQVDAFADRIFHGNPAAVCLVDEIKSESWMQHLADEMNLSETAFVSPRSDGFSLRWFTPVAEVDLCGHATLASAHILWEQGRLDKQQPARFRTRSGWLTAYLRGLEIEMDFPAQPAQAATSPPGLEASLGVEAEWVGRNSVDFLVVVGSDDVVRGLQPNFSGLARLDCRVVIVTSASSDPGFDFVSRCFAPRLGVNEDPVTGSAHCCLGPYWGKRLGREQLVGYQASSRGGRVAVGLQGDRCLLRGRAITVFRCQPV